MAKKTRKVGRDAENGKFLSLKKARKRKKTAIVQTINVGRRKSKPGR